MSCQQKIFYNLNNIDDFFDELYGEKTDSQVERYNKAFSEFKKLYSVNKAYICSSSGRVEVCGNHTDHNGGKVICCAINLDSLAMFLPTDDNVITLFSDGYGQMVVDLNKPSLEKLGTSPALIRGVVEGCIKKGFKVGGFNAYVTSNVLGGAGISSSASFEVLIAEIINFLYNDGQISQKDKAIIAQYAEREFFGKPCGLLDQSAISFGGLKMLDFSLPNDIIVSNIKNNLSDYTLILINTGGSHANLTDEYASIPKEMFDVAKAYGKERLIELNEEEFYTNLSQVYNDLSDRAVSRTIHFFNENKRVDGVYQALNCGDYDKFLSLIKKSGISSVCKLQNCYVSGSSSQPIIKALSVCEEFLDGGANRVHGGGFAGCILNIVENAKANDFIDKTSKIFGAKNVIRLKVRSVGAKVL